MSMIHIQAPTKIITVLRLLCIHCKNYRNHKYAMFYEFLTSSTTHSRDTS